MSPPSQFLRGLSFFLRDSTSCVSSLTCFSPAGSHSVLLSQFLHDLWSRRLLTAYFRYFCTFISSYHPQIRPVLSANMRQNPQGYIQLLSRIAFQQSCSLKPSDKQAVIHRGWWDFVHILSTGHELEYLPNLVWNQQECFHLSLPQDLYVA